VLRMMDFSQAWGYRGLVLVNYYAYRSTDPREMFAAALRGVDIVGSENLRTCVEMAQRCAKTVCCWGANVIERPSAAFLSSIKGPGGLWCLGLNQGGTPKHPLYLPKITKLEM